MCGSTAVSADGFANPVLNDVKRALPKIAELLGVNQDDLRIYNSRSISKTYMDEHHLKDRVIEFLGLDGMPAIMSGRRQASLGGNSSGIVLFECRDNPEIKYVIISVENPNGYVTTWNQYYIIPVGKVFRFARHVNRQDRKCSIKKPPILMDGVLEEIENNTINFLLNKKEIEKYDVKIRRGILLSGPPGNGKSLTCRWIKKLCIESGITYGSVSGSEIEASFAKGEGIQQWFSAYTVTFYDDIDISYLSRTAGRGNLACSILSAMDGVSQDDHVIRIFTTNEGIESLDEAFMRPGRIDRCFHFDIPDEDMRIKLAKSWNKEILDYLDGQLFDALIDKTDKFSFAELESIKSLMVTNKLMGSGKWDLDKAFEDYHATRSILKEKKSKGLLGFKLKPAKMENVA